MSSSLVQAIDQGIGRQRMLQSIVLTQHWSSIDHTRRSEALACD